MAQRGMKIGPEHYQAIVDKLSVDQLLKLQEKMLDEEDSFELLYGADGRSVWEQCWDIIEAQIVKIA